LSLTLTPVTHLCVYAWDIWEVVDTGKMDAPKTQPVLFSRHHTWTFLPQYACRYPMVLHTLIRNDRHMAHRTTDSLN